MFLNKRVLITGSSKGLGKEVAKFFERNNAKVAMVARSENLLKNIYSKFANKNKHLFFSYDLTDVSSIIKLKKEIINNWGGLDIIVHCIGGSFSKNDFLIDSNDFITLFINNLTISSEINRVFFTSLKKNKFSNIIHISSISGNEVTASVGYSTVKAAVSGYVRSFSKSAIKHNIYVSGILPGPFLGDHNSMHRFKKFKKSEYKNFVNQLPGKKLPKAKDFIPLVSLLSGINAKVMSGSLINADSSHGNAFFNFK